MTLPPPFFCFPSDNTVFLRVIAAKQEATDGQKGNSDAPVISGSRAQQCTASLWGARRNPTGFAPVSSFAHRSTGEPEIEKFRVSQWQTDVPRGRQTDRPVCQTFHALGTGSKPGLASGTQFGGIHN